MSYLEPPPMPAPVIVMKDVGGPVANYQSQTAIYRASEREVRLHECRSACTMALSLPNVCVYPSSTLKFHVAYDPAIIKPTPKSRNNYLIPIRPRVRAAWNLDAQLQGPERKRVDRAWDQGLQRAQDQRAKDYGRVGCRRGGGRDASSCGSFVANGRETGVGRRFAGG